MAGVLTSYNLRFGRGDMLCLYISLSVVNANFNFSLDNLEEDSKRRFMWPEFIKSGIGDKPGIIDYYMMTDLWKWVVRPTYREPRVQYVKFI